MKKILVLVSVSLLGGCSTMTDEQWYAIGNGMTMVGGYYGQQAQFAQQRSLQAMQNMGNYNYRPPVANVYGAPQVQGYQPAGQKLCTSGWC